VEGIQCSELRQIPGRLEAEKEPDREGGRAIEKARQLCRFEQVSAETVVPTLRQMMLDLKRQGHQARLQTTGSGKVCLEIEVRASPARRGTLLVDLEPDDPGTARVEIASHQADEREAVAVDRLDTVFVVDRVLRLVRKLLEPAPARPAHR
jgi:hypothetical protein